MTRTLRVLQYALAGLLLSLVSACGGGGSDTESRVEQFPVAPVMRQLATGISFTGTMSGPQTGSVTQQTTVVYAPTGPGAFERRQTFASAQSRDPASWTSSFVDSAAGGGLRFSAFNGGWTTGALDRVHEMPARAAPDAAETVPARPEQELFFAENFLGSIKLNQWSYQWTLVRKSELKAELCLAMNRLNPEGGGQIYTDCFEIDEVGKVLKARTIYRAQCCRLPEIVEAYE